jgi:hypothetical protein
MLLLRQLPTNSMSTISSIRFPSFDAVTFPSYTSILLSLLASLVLVSFIRAAALCLRGNISKRPQQQQSTTTQTEVKSAPSPQIAERRRSTWSWSLPKWDSLSAVKFSLPVSLDALEKESFGKGVGLQRQRREEKRKDIWQPPRLRRNAAGPAFQTPRQSSPLLSMQHPRSYSLIFVVPAIYQAEPVSMAKIIMSRHVSPLSLPKVSSPVTHSITEDLPQTHG